uniref:Uncharacterized protein n=1 Tax=Panagrolaimus superbus TaxID=310955 RepID=A0A914Z4V4_9BILA
MTECADLCQEDMAVGINLLRKFQKAIDYLDQIFEDLKKEVEPPTSISSEHKSEIPPPPLSTRGIQAAKAVFQKQQPTASIPPQQQQSLIGGPQTNNVPIVRLRKPSELAFRQQQQNQAHQQQHQQQQVAPILHQPQPIRNGFGSTGATIPKTGFPTPLRHPTSAFQSQPSTSTTNIITTIAPLTSTTNGANNVGAGPKPFPKIESGDVEISETIILPSKGNPEKMNFTRQWLAGDIKSWAEKPDLIVPSGGDLTSPNDSDDRSIGSCSAEVAAINALDRKKKRQIRETPDIIKSSKTTTSTKNNNNNSSAAQQQTKSKQQSAAIPQQPILPQPILAMPAPQPLRPQPLRPQPQYASFPINGQLSTTVEPSNNLQKAPSHEYVMAIQRAHQERAGSQDYQSLGSVHSQDGYKPLSTLSLYSNSLNRSGAFQQYPQRGSIHSLPDASLTTSSLLSRPQQPHLFSHQSANYGGIQQDPILAMDALVAELELNTDLDRNGEKRRSFPTGYGGNGHQNAMNRNNNFRPLGSTTVTSTSTTGSGIPRHGSLNIKPSNNGGSMDRGLRRMQIQHRSSLDEMANMLTNVAGDLKPTTTPTAKSISNGHSQPKLQNAMAQQQHQQQQQQQQQKKFALKSGAVPEMTTNTNKIGFSPFETINQERFAPSRVGAMQQMFETKKQTSSSNGNH